MKSFRTPLLLALTAAASFLRADTIELDDVEDQDIRALREWIDTKRQISLKEVGGDLSLSGEVRTEFQSTWEEVDGKNQFQRDSGKPARGFDIEFNLMLDYRTERTWASVKVEFDDSAGVFSGTSDKIALERAYWGVRVVEMDALTFDIEIGRRSMSSIFDSRVQYGSNFDGIVLRYDHSFEKVGDFYIHAGPFVINENRDQFGYVGEAGLLSIAGTGFYLKFSCIDWATKKYPDHIINERFDFINTQLTAGYRFKVESIEKIGLFYSGFVWNWKAKPRAITDYQRENWALYAGFSMGQLLKQWDWAFDANYQVVGAQSVPDFDSSGIGIGITSKNGFYVTDLFSLGTSSKPAIPNTVDTAGGNVNFQGFVITFDLLLTSKLDMQQRYVQTWRLNDKIGPSRSFAQYELEFIYSW